MTEDRLINIENAISMLQIEKQNLVESYDKIIIDLEFDLYNLGLEIENQKIINDDLNYNYYSLSEKYNDLCNELYLAKEEIFIDFKFLNGKKKGY